MDSPFRSSLPVPPRALALSGSALFILVALLGIVVVPVRAARPAAGTCAAPAEEKLASPYTATYSICDLGHFSTASSGPHGIGFKPNDPNILLIEGGGVLYSVPVIRDAENHITAFSSTVTSFATTTFDGSAVESGPGGVLFYTRGTENEVGQFKPGSTVPDSTQSLGAQGVTTWVMGLRFVPPNFPNAGELRLMSQVQGGVSNWYTATYAPDGAGTFNITSATLVTSTIPSARQFIYVMPGSPLFSDYHTILVSEWSPSKVVAYTLDANGNPLPGTRQEFINGLGAASSQAMDPLTGDIIFSGGGASGFVSVRGFSLPPVPNDDQADLKITQSLAATPAGLPTRLTFSLTVKNQGPDPAGSVVVTDTIAASLKFLSASSSGGQACTFDAGSRVVSCPLDTLSSGGIDVVSISTSFVTKDPLSNCAGVKSNAQDPDSTNNSACADFDPNGADLQLSVTGTYRPTKDYKPGAAFNLQVVNNGPGIAYKPVVTGVLPNEVDYAGAFSSSLNVSSVPVKCSFASDTRVVTCTYYNLRAGQKAWVVISTRAHPGAQQTEYCAEVSSTTPDWDPGDNKACSAVFLTGANLKVTKTNSLFTVLLKYQPVKRIHYTLNVTNKGPQPAQHVVVTDTLPIEIKPVLSSLPKYCNYNSSSRTLVCIPPYMAPGGVFGYQFNADFTPGTNQVTNCLDATSDTLDLEPASNHACSTQQLTGVDVSIVKTGQQLLGTNKVGFSLAVTNKGPDLATGLIVTDTLASGLRFLGGGFRTTITNPIPPGKCAYAADTRTFTCKADKIPSGKTYVITFQAEMTVLTASVVNCAETSTTSNDYDLSNSQSCVSIRTSGGFKSPSTAPESMSEPDSSPGAFSGPAWDPLVALLERVRTVLALPRA